MIPDSSTGDRFLPVLSSHYKQFLKRPPYTITFNWAWILFGAFFVAYGFFGAMTPGVTQFKSQFASSITMLGIIMTAMAMLGMLAWKAPDRFRDSISIDGKDLLLFVSCGIVLLIFSHEQLGFSLYGDELAYSTASQRTSINLSDLLIRKVAVFDAVPFKYLVQATSLFLLSALVLLFSLTRRITWKSRIILFSILLLCGRLAFTAMGGNSNPHPPLNLVPSFVFSTIFGIQDWSFKASYFVVYVIFILAYFKMLLRSFLFVPSCFLALAIATMPLLWHLGGIVEQSLWCSLCFIFVLLEITTSEKPNYMRMMSIVSIATLMRQPSFLAIVPIALLVAGEIFKSGHEKIDRQRLLFLATPILLFIPFLGKSIVSGTPSTDSLENSAGIFLRILTAARNNVIWESITLSVPPWWYVFIPCAFIPFARKDYVKKICILSLFMSSIVVYYSITPGLHGDAKYQAEYAVPFAITGMICIAAKITEFAVIRGMTICLALLLIALNVYDFVTITHRAGLADSVFQKTQDGIRKYELGKRLLCAYAYNYHDAYDLITALKLTDYTYSAGVTSGILPEIMHGYSTKSIRNVKDISKSQETSMKKSNVVWTSGSADLIDNDNRIRVVILGLVYNKQKLIEQLLDRGWTIAGDYKNIQFGSSVIVMQRRASWSLFSRRASYG